MTELYTMCHVTVHVVGQYMHIHVSFSQDTLPALELKTYFVRTTNSETALEGAKVTMLTPAKKIAENINEDIPMENDISTCWLIFVRLWCM